MIVMVCCRKGDKSDSECIKVIFHLMVDVALHVLSSREL